MLSLERIVSKITITSGETSYFEIFLGPVLELEGKSVSKTEGTTFEKRILLDPARIKDVIFTTSVILF